MISVIPAQAGRELSPLSSVIPTKVGTHATVRKCDGNALHATFPNKRCHALVARFFDPFDRTGD
jgi:hypothetical protein